MITYAGSSPPARPTSHTFISLLLRLFALLDISVYDEFESCQGKNTRITNVVRYYHCSSEYVTFASYLYM